jgi:hypothetical protein
MKDNNNNLFNILENHIDVKAGAICQKNIFAGLIIELNFKKNMNWGINCNLYETVQKSLKISKVKSIQFMGKEKYYIKRSVTSLML